MSTLCVQTHLVRLVRSLERLTGRALFAGVAPDALERAAFSAPFALLSHGLLPAGDPALNYANAATIALFSLEEGDVGSMPTRLTAAPGEQAARASMLAEVAARGFSTSYSGPRVSRCGSRAFTIRDATVWNVCELEDGGSGALCGQAALFSSWEPAIAPAPARPPPLITHVRARCLPEHAALFHALTLDNARRSAALEPGCLRFDVVAEAGDPASLLLIESFADADAAAAHKLTPHYLRWRDAVAPLMAAPRAATPYVGLIRSPDKPAPPPSAPIA